MLFISDAPVQTRLADARIIRLSWGGRKIFLLPKDCHSSRTLWGLPAPTPRVTFSSAKKSPKRRRGHPGPRSFSYADFIKFGKLLFRITFCHLICGLMVNDASAFGPLKGVHVSRGAKRNHLRETHKNIYAGASDTKHPPQGVEGGGLVCWSEADKPMRGSKHHRKTQGSRGDKNSICGGT